MPDDDAAEGPTGWVLGGSYHRLVPVPLPPDLAGWQDEAPWSPPAVPPGAEAVWLSDTPLGDGAVPPPAVGDLVELPLRIWQEGSVLFPAGRPEGAAGAAWRAVEGVVAAVEQHSSGGTLVLRADAGGSFTAWLTAEAPSLVVGTRLVLHGEVDVDPFDTGLADTAGIAPARHRVVALQRLVAPLVPLSPDTPLVRRAAWEQARSRDIADVAVCSWHADDLSIAFLLWVVRA